MGRKYHAIPHNDGWSQGFILCFEDGDEMARVPEADHLLFFSEDVALEFARELELPEPEDAP